MDCYYEVFSDSESSSESESDIDLDSDSDSFDIDEVQSVAEIHSNVPMDIDMMDEAVVSQSSTEIRSEESVSLKDVPMEKPYEGQMFESVDEAKKFYNEYARRWGFGVRIRDSRRDKARDNMLTRLCLVCDREGNYLSKLIIQDPERPVRRRNTSTQKCGCMARFVIAIVKSGRWRVTDFHEQHNHNPVTPSKQICMKQRRHMPMAAKALVESFRECNLPVSKVVSLLDGKSVGFDERDCYNHLGKNKPYKTPIEGDANAMAQFFCKKQAEDPQFFYAILLDKDSRGVNFLWIDGRSRSQYQHFGDVLYFDTTYKKNVYKMPFAPFTGVNHHLQSIQFGCALLLDETEESFVWAFETWLQGMGGKAPKSIITDQDQAMSRAVARVFPDSTHRFCLWHVMKKFPEKLSHLYKKNSDYKKQMKWCIRGFYRIPDFENRWNELMDVYNLTENDWLKNLYTIRKKWVPVYHLDIFYAGMNTTGRSEGMNSFYKRFFSRHTTLRDFAFKNEQSLERMVEREKKEDYISEHKDRVVDSVAYLLQFASKLCTRGVYVKFKQQWDLATTRYKLISSSHVDECHEFIYRSRNEKDPRQWKVEFNTTTLEGKCECKLFESMNIPCGHLIKVFQSRDLDVIPESFIAKRWLQGANEYRAKYDGGVVTGHQNSKILRATHLAKLANTLVYDAADDDECYTFMAQKLQDLAEQYKDYKALTINGKTVSSVGCNNIVADTVPLDTQAPPIDVNQSQPPNVGNPRISKFKGRETQEEKDMNSHRSENDRYRYGLEKNQRKREYKQRECSVCKHLGHNMRSCPNRKK